MTAHEITKLLAARHSGDVFVPECKDGPTQDEHHIRLDAWAMARSWRHMCMTGYEIKVSRSDFMADHKWHKYLELCNEFWFVTPPGIISKTELPPEAGLIEVSKTGNRLLAKKRPAWRDIKPPAELLYYILMCRTTITRDRLDRAAEWRAWLEIKAENRRLGYSVARAIREHVERVENTNKVLIERMSGYDDMRQACLTLGLNPERATTWQFRRKLDEVRQAVPKDLEDVLGQHRETINRLITELQKIKA